MSARLDEHGIDPGLLKQLKVVERCRLCAYTGTRKDAKYIGNGDIWSVPCQIALPCPNQNELNGNDVKKMVEKDLIAVAEASMPTTPEAAQLIEEASRG